MTIYALAAAILGLFAGLLLGLLIHWIMIGILPEEGIIDESEDFFLMAPFFGMAFGSIIGSVLGGLVGIKK